jgi:hypothetical protein
MEVERCLLARAGVTANEADAAVLRACVERLPAG